MATPRVLMTGATGLFGRYLASELAERGCELIVLTRARDDMHARVRVHEAIGFPREGGLQAVRGDVTDEALGLSRAGRMLAQSADVVLHAAAATDGGLDLDAARRVNFQGTRNILGLAHRIPRLEKLVHVSTAAVAGRRYGHVLEPQLQDAGFVNAQERSKFEGERLVRAHSQVLPIAVVRPSIVPEAARPLRLALDLVARGVLRTLPGAPTNPLDLIPAADAAAAIALIVLARGALGTFHVASGERAPRVTDVIRIGSRRRVRFVEHAHFARKAEPLSASDAISPFVGALGYPKTFDTARTEAVLGLHPCSGDPLDALVDSWPLNGRASVSGRLLGG